MSLFEYFSDGIKGNNARNIRIVIENYDAFYDAFNTGLFNGQQIYFNTEDSRDTFFRTFEQLRQEYYNLKDYESAQKIIKLLELVQYNIPYNDGSDFELNLVFPTENLNFGRQFSSRKLSRRKLYTGPRGGRYYLNKGKKIYI